ncbi:MAG: TraR/DksA C4-type zinc finger protein [Candidatus Peribacteraceae bacterium]|nr:TraR/DksA C4-type zinc finger protein [Candidatus Peribacteraceae bacterium]
MTPEKKNGSIPSGKRKSPDSHEQQALRRLQSLESGLRRGLGVADVPVVGGYAEPDNAADAELVEMTLMGLQRDSETLARVQEAIGRIREGTYRECVACGVTIPWTRLDAMPFTKQCVRCQATSETGEATGTPSVFQEYPQVPVDEDLPSSGFLHGQA